MLPVRVLLVDDSVPFLDSAARFLEREPGLEVVGRALSGAEAVRQSQALRPDLVLLDWALPDANGLETMQLIRRQPDAPQVIIVTMYDLPEYVAAAQAARADGFVAKSDFSLALLPLIHHLFADYRVP